jgi:hypothetical protein
LPIFASIGLFAGNHLDDPLLEHGSCNRKSSLLVTLLPRE